MLIYPKTFIALALAAIGFVGAPEALNFSTGQPTAVEKRVSALETTVSSLQATVTSLTAEEGVASASDATATPKPATEPTDVPSVKEPTPTKTPLSSEASLEGTISSAMVGNASPSIPPLNNHTYQVGVLRQRESSVWLVVRNNSDETINNIDVDVVARDAKGAMLAVGGASGFMPVVVEPGQIAIGSIGFGSAKLPKDVVYEYDVKVYEGRDSDLLKELQIIEYSFIENRIVGLVQNPAPKALFVPRLDLFCFDVDGNFLGIDGNVISSVDPESTTPFQIEYPEDCPTYLLYASGF